MHTDAAGGQTVTGTNIPGPPESMSPYEMNTNGSPEPAVAKPRGLDMAKYVYGLVTTP